MKYSNKKVLILGLGLNEGGVGSARFFAKNGAEVIVTDLKNETELAPSLEKLKEFPNIKYSLGGHKKEDIDWADLIIRNPALKPSNEFLIYAKSKNKQFETDMGIFIQSVNPENIIGVTGTKGKSTTASLIYEVLKKLHLRGVTKKVIFAGNIGKSVLDILDFIENDTIIVLEISSFQLEALDEHSISPHIAVITNIYPDHLNYYSSYEEYIRSKRLIFKNQLGTDFLFINKNDEVTNRKDFLKDVKSKIIYHSKSDLPKDFSPKLLGEANRENIAAALSVLKTLEIPQTDALEVLKNFGGVPFRMELIKEWRGVKIYNNTTATTPEPAIESLKSLASHLSGGRLILIAGGMNKGLDYREFAKAIEEYAAAVYFLEGDATENLKFRIQNSELMNSSEASFGVSLQASTSVNHSSQQQAAEYSGSRIKGTYNNLENLLKDVKTGVKTGDIILFSPGATSFNLFQNEFDRGRKFNKAVKEVFE